MQRRYRCPRADRGPGPRTFAHPPRAPVADSHQPQSIGAVLGELLNQGAYRQKIDEARAVEAWPRVVPAGAVRETETLWIRDGVLTVKLRSAAWRHTLHLQREGWREKLNAHLGRETVREIVFR